MMFRILVCLSFIGVFLSCQELPKEGKKDHTSTINRDEIDAFFGTNTSQLLFNHLYVVVDSMTYTSLTKDHHWKNTYGTLDIGLPNFDPVPDNSSTACYLRGHQHYIEILGPDNIYNEPVGKSGIGFSLKNREEHFHLGVKPKLAENSNTYLQASEIVDMPINEAEKTWFKAFYTPSPGTALHTWYAFYDPSFLDELHQESTSSYSREAFLKESYSEERLFNGINRISLKCTSKDFERIAQELRHLGCKLIESHDDFLLIASGDIELKISTSKEVEYSHITQIHCLLNTPDKSITQLGNLVISNEGTESVWNFDALYKKQ